MQNMQYWWLWIVIGLLIVSLVVWLVYPRPLNNPCRTSLYEPKCILHLLNKSLALNAESPAAKIPSSQKALQQAWLEHLNANHDLFVPDHTAVMPTFFPILAASAAARGIPVTAASNPQIREGLIQDAHKIVSLTKSGEFGFM